MKDLDLYLKDYTNNLSESLLNIKNNELKDVTSIILDKIRNKKNIFVCGNGGSAAIANHYVCDYIKFFRDRTNFKPKIVSLSSNLETITAISNDISYDKVFRYQAESLANKDDLIIILVLQEIQKILKNC